MVGQVGESTLPCETPASVTGFQRLVPVHCRVDSSRRIDVPGGAVRAQPARVRSRTSVPLDAGAHAAFGEPSRRRCTFVRLGGSSGQKLRPQKRGDRASRQAGRTSP